MSSWRQTFSEDVLIPRRIEERETNRLKSIQRILNQEHTESDLDLEGIKITTLGNVLKSVGGYLDLQNTPITNLGNLQSVRGWLDLRDTPITNLGNLQSVRGWLDLQNTPITNLGNLQSVGGYLDLRDTPIAEMTKEQRQEILKNVKVGGKILYA